MAFDEIVRLTKSYYCLDCGKCTGSCPVARVDVTYSPRGTIESVLSGYPEELINHRHLWSCLTCGLCTTRCPSGVDYPAFVIAARIEALVPIAKLRVAHERNIAGHDLVHSAQTVGVVGYDEPVERAG